MESTNQKKDLHNDNLIIREAGKNVYNYLSEHCYINESNVGLISTTTPLNIENLQIKNIRTIINLKKVNDMRYINKFFETVNKKLPEAGIFMGCAETNKQRYKRISAKFSHFIGKIAIILDFILTRIILKLPCIKYIYFSLTQGRGQMLSKAEVLGRLIRCGFEIIEFKEINDLTYFVVMKTSEPKHDNPSFYPIYRKPMIGKDGRIINVYKFRTTHPYSEYIEDFVLSYIWNYEIDEIPSEDIRLTKWGKFMKKFWLDELPQLINVLKGEMVLVGTRPLSKEDYSNYPDDLKAIRNKYKQGCIPPYIALLKSGKQQSIEADRIFLKEMEKNPYTTKIKYFSKAIYNIVSKRIRGW